MNILNHIERRNMNVQTTMTAVLKLVYHWPKYNCQQRYQILQEKLPNTKVISIQQLKASFPMRKDEYPGPACRSLGLKSQYLHSCSYHFQIPQELLLNGVIYELERYRQNHGFPSTSAFEWTARFFPTYEKETSLASSHHNAWVQIYEMVTKEKSKPKNENRVSFILHQPYKIPSAKSKAPESFIAESHEEMEGQLENPPLDKIRSAENPLLEMAKFTGEVMSSKYKKIEMKLHKKWKECDEKSETVTKLQSVVTNKTNIIEQQSLLIASQEDEMKKANTSP